MTRLDLMLHHSGGAGRYLRDMMKPKDVAMREKLLRLSALNESILNEITGNISP